MRRCSLVLAGVMLAIGLAGSAGAQEYRFSVPSLDMQVLVQPDASVKIAYDITFQNSPGGHAIDVVDIGAPHPGYDLGTIQASINGHALGDIRVSQYVTPGFEVHLDRWEIQPGRSGVLHVEFPMPDLVYQDTTRGDYASLRITPTWFGEEYVEGTTQLRVAIHLPQGVQPEEVLHQGEAFQQKVRTAEGVSAVWIWPATRLTGAHLVGLSFPKRVMNRVVEKTKLDLLLEWFAGSPGARWTVAIAFFVMFAVTYFRFTGGTGLSVFVVLSGILGLVFAVSPGSQLLALPLGALLLWWNEWGLARRKAHYMPPIAQVEGGGIKRGLTAPEAAVLLELPLGRVLGLVIFGMLKKGLVRQVQADPLVVEVDEKFRTSGSKTSELDRMKRYLSAAKEKGIVMHNYEEPFLLLVETTPGKPIHEINFAPAMRQLIEGAAARMKGFDLSQTQDYYRSIVRQAVDQAKTVGDVQQSQQQVDRNFEWILLDDRYPTVLVDSGYQPSWLERRTESTSSSTPSGGAPSGTPSMPGQTTFRDVAASFAGWTESTMGSLAGAISPGALQLPQAGGGFLDLSGADRMTGAFFQALSEASSSGGGGGGGGGGGCACAGCACACACAGGGR